MTDIQTIARAYWDAEESRDITKILEFFTPDATWRGPGGVDAKGHDELRGFYDTTIARYPGLKVDIKAWYGSGEQACLEWAAVFTDARGQDFGLHGVNIMRARDGKIASLQVYFDPAELERPLTA